MKEMDFEILFTFRQQISIDNKLITNTLIQFGEF